MLLYFHIRSNSVNIRRTCWKILFILCSSNSLQNQLLYWLAWTADVTAAGEQTADQHVAYECHSYGWGVFIPAHPCNISSAASPPCESCSVSAAPSSFSACAWWFFLEGIPLPLYWNAGTQRPSPPVRLLASDSTDEASRRKCNNSRRQCWGATSNNPFTSLCRLFPSHPGPVFAY